MAETGKKAFIIGHPVAHSRSPVIHRHWLAKHGIAGSYERVDVAPDDLAAFVSALPESGFVGGNVTLPHKEAVCALVDELDEAARQIGAANTLWLRDGKVHAGNTDVVGFAANLDLSAPLWREAQTALVLGAGLRPSTVSACCSTRRCRASSAGSARARR
jgi:shikimate dehydrogenase